MSFLSISKKRVAASIAAGVPLVAGAFAWGIWLPEAVQSRAEVAVRERLGMRATIGDVDMRLRGAVLRDVVIEGTAGGVRVSVEEVGARVDLWSALFGGGVVVEEVQAFGVQVELDLTSEGFEQSIEAIRAARAGRDPASAAPRQVEGSGGGALANAVMGARAVNLTVDDEEGRLITVRDGEARMEGGRVTASALSTTLGAEPFDTLTADNARAVALRDDQGLRLESFEVEGGEVSWAFRAAPTAEEGQSDEPAAEGPRPTLARLFSFLERVRGPGDEPEAADPEDEGQPGWLRRLSDGAIIEVSEVNVASRTADGVAEPVLSDLRASLEKLDADRIRAKGEGTPGRRGSLAWDLTVAPAALRAQGSLSFEDLPLALLSPLVPQVPFHEPERSMLTGELEVDGEGGDRLGLAGRVAFENVGLASARVAPEPITGITFALDGQATFFPPTRRLELERATVQMGDAEVILQGALELAADHYMVDVTAALPPTDCGDAVAAIPLGLLGDLATFSLGGQIGGRISASVNSEALDDVTLDIDVSDGCAFETVPAIASLARVAGPFLHRVREPDGSWFEMTTGPGTGNWSSIYRISPWFVHAVLAHEDGGFFRHSGFSPWAIREALSRNLTRGEFVMGASTISMQLAKNLFLHREKYLARKVQEVLLTWWLETALDKTRILELYLNVIEYGPALYGVTEAAHRYFGVEAEDLTPAQGAFLACILPNPKLYYGQYERNELSESMRNRVARLLTHMHSRGRLDQAALDFSLAELETFRFHQEGEALPTPQEVPGSPGPLPFATPAGWDDGWGEVDGEDAWAPAQWDDTAFDQAFEDTQGGDHREQL